MIQKLLIGRILEKRAIPVSFGARALAHGVGVQGLVDSTQDLAHGVRGVHRIHGSVDSAQDLVHGVHGIHGSDFVPRGGSVSHARICCN